ncbi:hypothetical protein [Streptomyces sp. CRN 30]|uniref:hypothetical protein n=1 Tax=Streptomyces sp. CRN 30 TaxID=3075613 RepID=UPI002A813031|nr:hypothetical protein [Streptomyces sp. CRN 30]
MQGLVDLARGGDPEVAESFSMTVGWVLAALTVLATGLGARGVLRARRWAQDTARRPVASPPPRSSPRAPPP